MAINIVEEDGGAVRDITNANTDCPWGRYGGDCVCHTHGRRIPLSSLAAKPIIIDRQQVTIDFHRCLLINGKRGMVELRERADDLARRDSLTGLANRRALLEAAQLGT